MVGCEPYLERWFEMLSRLLVMLAHDPPNVVLEYDELSKSQEVVGAKVILS